MHTRCMQYLHGEVRPAPVYERSQKPADAAWACERLRRRCSMVPCFCPAFHCRMLVIAAARSPSSMEGAELTLPKCTVVTLTVCSSAACFWSVSRPTQSYGRSSSSTQSARRSQAAKC